LVPRNLSVFGLKMADADELKTVRRLSFATLGLAGLYVMHFVFHVAQHGHAGHAFVHLIFAAVLPGFGYYAIKQRSTSAVYGFHVMNVAAAVGHLLMMIMVLMILASIVSDDKGVACSSMVAPAHECPAAYLQNTFKGGYSADRRIWRCRGGMCISAAGRCNGEPNCYDHSDEQECAYEDSGKAVERLNKAEARKLFEYVELYKEVGSLNKELNETKVELEKEKGERKKVEKMLELREAELMKEQEAAHVREQLRNHAESWNAKENEELSRRGCERRFADQQHRAPWLSMWWVVMSLPIWGLNIYAGMHSLEFYVQLRVLGLKATVNNQNPDATVFNRPGQNEDDDSVE